MLGTCASIRVGFIAIVQLRRLAMCLMMVLMLLVLMLMLAWCGARLVAIAGWRGNAAMENTILCRSCARGGGSGIATTSMWWTVR